MHCKLLFRGCQERASLNTTSEGGRLLGKAGARGRTIVIGISKFRKLFSLPQSICYCPSYMRPSPRRFAHRLQHTVEPPSHFKSHRTASGHPILALAMSRHKLINAAGALHNMRDHSDIRAIRIVHSGLVIS